MASPRKNTNEWKVDTEMVERLKQGDNLAYSELIARFKNQVAFIVRKMIRNPDDVDDLVMEIFGKVFKYIHSYKPEYSFKTWLFRIANNHSIDFIRKKSLQTTSLDSNPISDESDDSGLHSVIAGEHLSPEQIMESAQRHEYVRQAISQLKPLYKDLIKLRYFEEKSYEEITEELGIPMGTVKARLYRAKDLLETILGKNPSVD